MLTIPDELGPELRAAWECWALRAGRAAAGGDVTGVARVLACPRAHCGPGRAGRGLADCRAGLSNAAASGGRLRSLWRGVRTFPDRLDHHQCNFHLSALG